MYHNLFSQLPVDIWDVLSLVEVISEMGVGMGYMFKDSKLLFEYFVDIPRLLGQLKGICRGWVGKGEELHQRTGV